MPDFRNIIRKAERSIARRYPVKTVLKRFEKPIVSFTYDDCPKSAIDVGAKILQKYGALGTYYICGGLTDQRENDIPCHTNQDLESLVRNGHELASHLFLHRQCQELTQKELYLEIKRSKEFIAERTKSSGKLNFSYPFGSIDVRSKKLVGQEFSSGRGIEPGLNVGKIDLSCLKARALYEYKISENMLQKWIEEAVDQNGWLIFYTHDVCREPSPFGISPDKLEFAIKTALEKQCEIKTVASVLNQFDS